MNKPSPRTKMKPVRKMAYIVLTKPHDGDREKFVPFGNGAQWQYPVFHEINEAKDWVKEDKQFRGRIIPVEIRELPKSRKK